MVDRVGNMSTKRLLPIKNGKYPLSNTKSTDAMDDDEVDMDDSYMDVEDEDTEPLPELGPAALGLQRVGTKPPPRPAKSSQPIQVLNRRGMPARIRKKNKLFFDDALVNHPHHRVKKEPRVKRSKRKLTPMKRAAKQAAALAKVSTPHEDEKEKEKEEKEFEKEKKKPIVPKPLTNSTPVTPKSTLKVRSPSPVEKTVEKTVEKQKVKLPASLLAQSSPDRRIGQKIGMRLRNLLKLPKAHKWVCYEWFYSNIDKCLFDGDNDFMVCLKESFPQLKARKLTRVEWCKIRRMMGKPRRCSQSFFEEERKELERKRQKIRILQQRKASDINCYKDLPSDIPIQLTIGQKVTARLRKPQDGLFTGSIDAVDTSNNTYRISFERTGLGTHSVPDFEVLSNEPPETISLSSFVQMFRPKHAPQYLAPPAYALKLKSPKFIHDPLISNAAIQTVKKSGLSNQLALNGNINGYPVKLLEYMVQVQKILEAKKIKINKLKEMNSEAEKSRSFDEYLPPDFERKYAAIVVDLEKMNSALQDYLNDVQDFCQEIAPEPTVAAMLVPSHLREKCRQEAGDMVSRINVISEKPPSKMNQLVVDLTALMLQIKCLSDSDRNAYELKVLQGTMEQIQSRLTPSNQQVFQNCVEIHVQHIQLGLSQMGQLAPFMVPKA